MKIRHRPYWPNHWNRFDGVYRSRQMREMWIVTDVAVAERYAIIRYAADNPEVGYTVNTIPYGPNAFTLACEMAQGLARTASRKEPSGLDHGHRLRVLDRDRRTVSGERSPVDPE